MGLVNIQVRDYEVQILDYLYGKYSQTGTESLVRLLREHAGYRPGTAGSIAALLRAIAEPAPSLAAEPPTALLDDLERSIDSFDEVHRR